MKENSQKNFRHILKEINSTPVNNKIELQLISQVLATITDFESKNNTTIPNEINTKNTNYKPISTLISSTSKLNLEQFEEQIESFPKLKLAILFVDQLFNEINQLSQLPLLLKNLIFKLRLPTLQFAIHKLDMVLKKNNIVLLLFNELFNYAFTWKDESLIGFPTYNQLSCILTFEDSDDDLLVKQFIKAKVSIEQIKTEQTKRSLIFEKRLKETVISQNKKQLAQDVVNNLVNEIIQNNNMTKSITHFINETWRKLLELEYVRDDNNAFTQAVETMVMLVVSIKPLTNKQELNWLMDTLPTINERITDGAEKLTISEQALNSFLSEINAIHILSMGQAIELPEEEIEQNKHSSSDENNSNNKSNEAILRLKPKHQFSTNNALAKKNKTLLQTIEHSHFNQHLKSKLTLSIEKFSQEYSLQKPKEVDIADKSISEKYSIHTGQWYQFVDENKTHKLLFINDTRGEYVFVDSSTKKTHLLHSEEFLKKLKEKQIVTPQTLTTL